jgi:23S rRNA (adenine2503-C2)-methyltransferase
MADPPSIRRPSPLGSTFARYVEARPAGVSGVAAGDHYHAVFRDGLDAASMSPEPEDVLVSDSPEGPVRKFLLPVDGAERVPGPLHTESVVIPMRNRRGVTHSLCVSSQVGCAMGCGFCETAQMGLVRSLTIGEIVRQWHAATFHLQARVKNVVFMGMGEPLDNLEGVLGAIEVLTDHHGPAIPMSNVTVSTVGHERGLVALRERVTRHGWRRLNLAVSINAPNDEIRSALMPVNRSLPLERLVGMLRAWPSAPNRAICAEYVLIPGVNDEPGHADELAALLRGLRCCVNVIPYNPRRDSPWPAPSEASVERFLARLMERGQFCKRRKTKGRASMAACGQLGAARIRGRRLVELTTPG